MLNLRNILATLAILMVVSGCATSPTKSPNLSYGQVQLSDQRLMNLFKRVISEDNIRNDDIVVVDEPGNGMMSASTSERKIFVNSTLVSQFTDEQIMFMIAHELGHMSAQGKPLNGPKAGEQFADYYAILLLNEMNIPILSAISIFQDPKAGGIHSGGDIHGTNQERYTRLLEKAKEAGMKL